MNTSIKENHSATEPATPTFDLLVLFGLVPRHWPLFMVCALVATVVGVLGYSKVTPIFEATTKVVIETKSAEVFNNDSGRDYYSYMGQSAKHRTVLGSTMIMKRAVEKGGLQDLDFAKQLEPGTDLAEVLQDGVVVSAPEDYTQILNVSYRSTSKTDCAVVANSIAAAYDGYLTDQSVGSNAEVSKLIEHAKTELMTKLNTLEEDYADFRQDAPILWKDGVAIDLHQERQFDLEQKRKELMLEKSVLDSRFEKLSASIAKGGEAKKAVYYEALNDLSISQWETDKGKSISRQQQEATASTLSQGLSNEYVELTKKERELSERFGAGHPELAAIRTRLTVLRRSLKVALASSRVESATPKDAGMGPDYANLYVMILSDRAAVIEDQLKNLDTQFKAEEKSSAKIQSLITRDHSYRTEIERNQKLFDSVVKRLDEIGIVQNYDGDRINIIEPAVLGEKVSTSLVKMLALFNILGFMIAGIIAFWLESGEESFSGPAEIRKILEAPVLAQIPTIKNARLEKSTESPLSPSLQSFHFPKSRFAEAFRGLRTALFFNSSRQNIKVLQVTSPLPGDGKSTLIANLAISIAKSGKSVVLVDADCRRPQVHRIFGLAQGDGVTQVLKNQCDLDDAIVPSGIEDLFLIRSGEIPNNPAELLSSENFSQMLSSLRESFDFVLVDSPPVLAVTDGCAVAAKVDGVVMVVRLTKRAKHSAVLAKQSLDEIDANMIGVVANTSMAAKGNQYGGYGGQYGYSYGYGYGHYGSETSAYYEDSDDATNTLVGVGVKD